MKTWRILIALFALGALDREVFGADLDMPLRPSVMPEEASPRWEGIVVGLQTGAFLGTKNILNQIAFPPGGLPTIGPASLVPSGILGGAYIGFDKQWGRFVFGAGVDADLIGGWAAKTSGSGSFLGLPYTTVQTERMESLGTVRARVGYAVFDDLLVYGTAGLAFGQARFASSLDFPNLVSFAGSRSNLQIGLAAGAGLEYALDPHWSIAGEFLYYDLGRGHVVSIPDTIVPVGEMDTDFALKGYVARLGLNYTFGGPADPATALADPSLGNEVAVRVGTRAGMSTSTARMTLYDTTGNMRLSRLTYHNPSAPTGEVFGQIDDNSGVFIKGYGGIGKEIGGKLQDEDFPLGIAPYSSTDSPQKDGHLGYVSADVGYYGLTAPQYKLGGFIGYHFLDEQFNAFGCTQTAGNPQVCSPGQVAPGNLTISDDGTWQSLRVGLAGQLVLPAGFSLRAEAAWLPLMRFAGGNNHWLREPTDFSGGIPEKGMGFNGIQAEGEIDYALSPNFDVGAGARFWSLNAKGHVLFQDVTLGGDPQVATFASQRIQAFLQSDYRF